MKDIERKVTEFLKDDAADAHRPAQMPDGMTKRIRRHQTRTALVTGSVTLAIIVVSVAAFRTVLPLAADKQTPAGPGFGGGASTTASLSYATITYPGDWHLVEYQGATGWSDAAVQRGTGQAPILMLTNYAPRTTARGGIDCPGPDDFPAGGVGFIVGATPGIANYGFNELPKAVRVFDRTTCTVGDGLQFTKWNQYGMDYLAAAWADDGASQADTDALQAAFQSLHFPASQPDPASGALTSPADVLFAGGTGQDAWRIVSYPWGDAGARVDMRASTTATSSMMAHLGGGRKSGFGLAFPRWPMNGGGPTGSQDLGPAVLYGTVAPGQSVGIRTGGGSMLPAQLKAMPAYGDGLDAFAIPMGSLPPDGTVVVTRGEGGPEMTVPLASLAVFSSSFSGSSDDPEVAAQMALLAADTWFADHGTYEGFTVQEASKIDPSLNWTDPSMNVRGDTVDITKVTPDSILVNAYPKDWTTASFCAAHTPDGTFVESVWGTQVADCTPDSAAQTRLRNALAAAKTFFTDGDTYEGLTPAKVSAIEPSVTFNASPAAVEGEVSIRLASTDTVLLVTRASNGSLFCIADTGVTQTYGTNDAKTIAECDLAAWPALSSSPAVPTPYPSVDEASRLNVHAKGDLRYAQAAAKTYFTDNGTYVGLTPDDLEASDPARVYGSRTPAEVGIVALRETTATTVLLVTRSETGQTYCLVVTGRSSELGYGDVDAMTAADCKGGWPI